MTLLTSVTTTNQTFESSFASSYPSGASVRIVPGTEYLIKE